MKSLFSTALRFSLYAAVICGVPPMYHQADLQTKALIAAVERADQQAFTPGYVPPPDVACGQGPQTVLSGVACTDKP